MNIKYENIRLEAVSILQKPNPKKALLELQALFNKLLSVDALLVSFSSPPFEFLPQCYLTTNNSLDFLGRLLPLDRDYVLYFKANLNLDGIHQRENSTHAIFSYLNDINIQDKLPLKERHHLFICTTVENKSLALFRLIGKSINCFTIEDEKLLVSLKPHLTLLLSKLYKQKEVEDFFAKNNLSHKQTLTANAFKDGEIVFQSPKMFELMETIFRLSNTDESVLILGETGTGKELIANAIQENSIRHNRPFVKVNCGAIPENLIDSVLFGHEKGAFTGADKTTQGKFEQADGGTLFLDELGELPLSAQVRLLRILQNYQVDRIGSIKSISVNVRIIAATNKDLLKMVQQKTFREDLFYRINTFRLNIPPLRERKEDIELLCSHFIETITNKMNLPSAILSKKSLEKLQAYHWPGNVRELENVIRCALVLDLERELDPSKYIYYSNDKEEIKNETIKEEKIAQVVKQNYYVEELHSLDDVLKEHILKGLRLCRGQIYGEKGAAKILGLHPETLRKRVIKLGLKEEIE